MAKQHYVIYGLIFLGGLILALSIRSLEKGGTGLRQVKRNTDVPISTRELPSSGQMLLGDLIVTVPADWRIERPSSSMRLGQFRLSGEALGEEDAELAVFSGIGGGAESNLNRWFNQFRQPDGSSSRDRARVERFTVKNMQVTMADLTGTYVGSRMSMSESVYRPGYRLLAAIVGTSDDFYYFKLLGPRATVSRWAESFEEFIRGIRQVSG